MSGEYYLDQIRKCVTFVFDLSEKPLGTGFFASIKLEKGGYAVYFVTAKYVVQDDLGKYRENIYIRLNLHSGDSEHMGLPLSYAPDYILTHDDENIDLVAYLLNPPQDMRHHIVQCPWHSSRFDIRLEDLMMQENLFIHMD